MVSASHNPPEDNGIKIFGASGAKLSRQEQGAIEAGLRGEVRPALTGCGSTRERSELLAHYDGLLEAGLQGRRLDGRRIVLDLCWGSATACSAGLFRRLGAEVTVLHGEPDGTAINVGCGSTHLEPLRQAVLDQGAEMGFAFDGDADRVLAVDGRGRIVDGDHILFLWGSALAAAGQLPQQRLVATVMSNLGFNGPGRAAAVSWSAPPSAISMSMRRWRPVVRASEGNNQATSSAPSTISVAMACSRPCSWRCCPVLAKPWPTELTAASGPSPSGWPTCGCLTGSAAFSGRPARLCSRPSPPPKRPWGPTVGCWCGPPAPNPCCG